MTTSDFNKETNKIESLLFGFAMRLTRNLDDAKDLMQETLMRSFNNKDKFKEGTYFKSWLTTIMYNAYINNYRRKKTRNKVMKPVEDFNYMVENKSTEGNAYSRILMKELNNIVDNLADGYKVPFKMYVDGYQYSEISKEIDLPIGTVKSRIFYARKKLKGMVNERYEGMNLLAA